MSGQRPSMAGVAAALERVAIRHATLAQIRTEAAQRAAQLRQRPEQDQDTPEAPNGR